VEEALAIGGRSAAGRNYPARKISVENTAAVAGVAVAADLGTLLNPGKQIQCDLTGDGRLRIRATRLFWATHFIRFVHPEYHYMFSGRRRQTSGPDDNGDVVISNDSQYAYNVDGSSLFGAQSVDNHRIFLRESKNRLYCTLQEMPLSFPDAGNAALLAPVPLNAALTAIQLRARQAYRNDIRTIVFGANLLSTSDRRVAVELGCSLPMVNNPMVDHGQEAPDITLGRWMFNPMVRIKTTVRGTGMEFESSAPDVYELQKATDRVQYHSLMPQDKIHFLRLKMYARVRKYDPARDRFDMSTLVYPMTKADWWHARLHFVSKD
jgi:hypothetical protein